MTGLMWLASRAGTQGWPFCLTFVRGADERTVLAGFGANPHAAASMTAAGTAAAPSIRVGRTGKWTFAMEGNIPPQGTRSAVLRRVSAGTEAVAIYRDIANLNHEFAHAYDSEVIAAVTTSVPPHWRGSDPEHFRPLAEELGLAGGADSDLDDLQVLLALTEGVFGLSLDETDYRSLSAVPILPVLDDLPAPQAAQSPPRVGDPVLDMLMTRVSDKSLPHIVSIRTGRAIADAGFDRYPVLVSAVQRVLADGAEPVTDDDPLGFDLRTAALDHPDTVMMLRFVLAGRFLDALTSDFHLHKRKPIPGWREQFIADLGVT